MQPSVGWLRRGVARSDEAELQKPAPFEGVGVFDFLELPAELRNRIYYYLIDEVKPAFVRKVEAILPRKPVPLWDLSLLQTCRQIRAEYRPLYLSHADLAMYFGDARLLLDSFWPLKQDYRMQPRRFWLIYDDRDDRTLSEKNDILYLIQLSMHWDTLAAYLYIDPEPKITESRLSCLIYNRNHRPSFFGDRFGYPRFGYPSISDSVGDFLNSVLHHTRLSDVTTSMIDETSDKLLRQQEIWRREILNGNITSVTALYSGGTLKIFVELSNITDHTLSTGWTPQKYLEDVGLDQLRDLCISKSRHHSYVFVTY